MTAATYPAVIRNGKAEPLTPLALPEGSQVYIVVKPKLDEETARKKATGWLVDQVGNLLMAADGLLFQTDSGWAWRFNVYLTSLTHEPRGPIGIVQVDADTAAILKPQRTKAHLYERGQQFIDSAPPTN